MDAQSILSLADELVFAKTGKHLDNLQADILKGTLTGQKYADIAKEHNVTRGYIKDIASNLWKILSEELEEDINKSNVVATLERNNNSNISHIGKDIIHIGDINFCGSKQISKQLRNNLSSNTPYLDLDDAPILNQFYGREDELKTLTGWIVQEKTQLITLCGLSGIGKTTLTLKLIETLQTHFNYVIYRNLQDFTNLDELLKELILIFITNEDTNITPKIQLRTLIKYLRQYRCLMILDNGQALLKEQELSGTYHPNYRNFSQLFQQIGQNNHQSCVILNSWEVPKEIETLADNSNNIKIFNISGLNNAALPILKDKNLKDEDIWHEIVQLYEGHPQWLKWVATMISDLWDGNIRESWKFTQLLLTNELKLSLETQLNRLSPLEYQILCYLSQETNPLTIPQVLSQWDDSPTDILNALQSLKKRGLILHKDTLMIKPLIGLLLIEGKSNSFIN